MRRAPAAISLTTGGVNNTGTITNSGSGTGDDHHQQCRRPNVTGVTQNQPTSRLLLSAENTFFGGLTIANGTVTGNPTTATKAWNRPILLGATSRAATTPR